MLASDVITKFRRSASGATVAVIDADTALDMLQEAVREYRRYRKLHGSDAITVADSTVDYAVVAGVTRIDSVWDLTGGDDAAVEVAFEQINDGAVKIRLAGPLPSAGTSLTYYYVTDHTIPATAGATLTVDDDDVSYLVTWMKALFLEYQSGTMGQVGKFTSLNRSEDQTGAATALSKLAKDLKQEVRDALNTPSAGYTSGRPMEQGSHRPDLGGAHRYQGAYGWTGNHPGNRRRKP